MYTDPYRVAFQALAQRMYFLDQSTPEVAIARWQAVVAELQRKDQLLPAGLDHALDLFREPLETFLVADELRLFPEHAFFAQQLQEIDRAFKDLTVESGPTDQSDFRWWNNRLPARWVQPPAKPGTAP